MSFIKRLLAEDEREQQEKNLFLLEKSKLYQYWTLCMDKVKTLKEDARISEVKRDKAEEARNSEKDYQAQKLRALQNEEMKNLGIIRLQHLKEVKRISDEIWDVENILRDAASEKRVQIRTQMRAQFEILRSLFAAHAQTLQNMMFNLSKAIRSKEIVWERHFDSRWDTSTKSVTKTDKQILAQKVSTLFMMNDQHERFLQDLKTFFNDMTSNNFAVISSLEQEIDAQKSTNNRLARDLRHIKAKYLNMTKPLEKMQENLMEWKDQNLLMKQTTRELHESESILQSKLHCENNLEILIELLVQRIENASRESQRVKSEFSKGLIQIQQKMNMNNLVNQLKLNSAQKDASILRALEPGTNKKVDKTRIKALEKQIDSQLRNIKRTVQDSMVDGTSGARVLNVKDVYVSENGLRRTERAILPPLLTPDNFNSINCFRGKSQGLASFLHYKGPQYVPKATSRNLGYGYYHIPPSDITPPPSRGRPITSEKKVTVDAATSTLRFSRMESSKSNVKILAAVPLRAVIKHRSNQTESVIEI
jgi:hypothetical protein